MRPQLHIESIQPTPVYAPLPSEVSDPIVAIDTSKMTLARHGVGFKEDHIRIKGASISSCESTWIYTHGKTSSVFLF